MAGIAAWLVAAAVANPPPTLSSSPPLVPQWDASVVLQAGTTGRSALPTLALVPSLSHRREQLRLTLQVPLWLRWPKGAEASTPQWLNEWSYPGTYSGFIRELDWRSANSRWRLRAGTLVQETLGVGAVLRGYSNALDPMRPRGGSVLRYRNDHMRLAALVNELAAPHLLAATARVAPLSWSGLDPQGRWVVGGTVALDWTAPASAQRRSISGAAALWSGITIWSSSRFGARLQTAAGALARGAQMGGGLLGGLQLEGRLSRRFGGVFSVEGVWAGRNYVPGYFDGAYQSERFGIAREAGVSKSALPMPSTAGVRSRFRVVSGPASWGWMVQWLQARNRHLMLFFNWENEHVQVRTQLQQRHLQDAADLWQLDAGAQLVVDAAVRLYEGLFVSSLVRHGWRLASDRGVEPVPFEWMVGLGYSMGGELR